MAHYQTVFASLLLVHVFDGFFLTLVLCQNIAQRAARICSRVLGVFEALYGLIQYLSGWQQIFHVTSRNYYLDDATAHTSIEIISLGFWK